MGKNSNKNRGKAGKSAAYKPSTGLTRPSLDKTMQKKAEGEPTKRVRK